MSEQHALVVDDSKVGRITMQKKLESIGVRVDMVESGPQALEYLAHHHPDMIFMDHMMPDMDGFETTRRIKASPATRDIPVIIFSGNDDVAFIQEARSAGALHAISKPPGPGVLEAILETLPKGVPTPGTVQAAGVAPGVAPVVQAPKPAVDRAHLSEIIERLLGEAMASLRGNLLEEARKQVVTELESTRGLLQRWGAQLDEARASVAGLLGNALNAETVGQQFARLEERMRSVEAAPSPSMPDLEALQRQVEQGLSNRLAELQARLEQQASRMERQGQESQADADARHAQLARGVDGLGTALDSLSAEMRRLAAEGQAAKAGHDQRLEGIEQRLQALQAVESPPPMDEAVLLAAVEERISPRLEAMGQEIQARLEALPPAPADEAEGANMAALFKEELAALRAEVEGQRANAEALAEANHALQAEIAALREALNAAQALRPAAEAVAEHETVTVPSQETGEALEQPAEAGVGGLLQAEIGQLKARVSTLTVILGVGGALLAVAVLAALFR